MRREISPMIAITLVVIFIAMAGGFYFFMNQSSDTKLKTGPGGLSAQSSKGPIPQQAVIPKASGS